MFCDKCGNKVKKSSSFCGKCGAMLKEKPKVKEKIIEIEEKEKHVESLAPTAMIYSVVALTMVLSFGIIIVCSII